jgi:hypothetical protein
MKTIISGEIKGIEDWYCKAPPKDGDAQWKDDYSAKEFARLWFDEKGGTTIPAEIRELVKKTGVGEFEVLFAIPEHVTPLVSFRGGQRNHDMFLFCQKRSGETFIVCIEAKVAEPLDATIKEKLCSVKNKEESKIPQRIDAMKHLLNMNEADVSSLRYQLFTGTVGTIREAEKYNARECLFLVLQIRPSRDIEKEIVKNRNSIEAFLAANGAKELFRDANRSLSKLNCSNSKLRALFGYLTVNKRP